MAKSRTRRRLRTVTGVFAIFVSLILAAVISTYLLQDQIVEAVLKEVNKSLKAPVEVDEVGFSPIRNFPQVSVSLQGLKVPPGAGNPEEPLLQAARLSVLFNAWDLIRGRYSIRSIEIENGELNLRTLANGEVNYNVAADPKEVEAPTEDDDSELSLDLQSVQIRQFLIRYANDAAKDEYLVYAEDTEISLSIVDHLYTINLAGDLQSRALTLGGESYLREKPVYLNTHLTYQDSTGVVEILPSKLGIRDSEFSVKGLFTPGSPDYIDLSISSDDVNLGTLVSLLPPKLEEQLLAYGSRGQMYFSGDIRGGVSNGNTPNINFNFGGQDVSLFHPKANQEFEHVFFEGNFTNGARGTMATTALSLSNVKGELNGKPFKGNFSLSNFDDYNVDASLSGQMDVPSLLDLAQLKAIEEADGYLEVEVQFKGRLKDLESAETMPRINTSGTLAVRDLNVTLADWPIPLQGISGTFRFNRSDLAIQNVQGQVGQSHLRFNGILNNLVGYLLLEDQDFVVQADLQSNYLDLDELLSGDPIEANEVNEVQEDQEYNFTLPPRVILDFNTRVKALNFRRFHASEFSGNLQVENQVAVLQDVSLRTMGGRMQMAATLDSRDSLTLPVDAQVRLERVDIDSIFYVLENFDQDYLTHENLKGQLFADIDILLPMDHALNLDMNALIAEISMSVKNGELNDFETMQELSAFVEEDELANLRFSELNNDLRIEQGKLFIPQMEVKTNLATLSMRGIHSFDQEIDYRFRIGLEEFRRPDRDSRFGVVEEDETGIKNVFLRVSGTIYDYEIEYDGEAARAYRRDQRKKNPFRLRDLFQSPDTDTKKPVLNEEEFFEWEEEEGDGG